jgi:hypothetical protein
MWCHTLIHHTPILPLDLHRTFPAIFPTRNFNLLQFASCQLWSFGLRSWLLPRPVFSGLSPLSFQMVNCYQWALRGGGFGRLGENDQSSPAWAPLSFQMENCCRPALHRDGFGWLGKNCCRRRGRKLPSCKYKVRLGPPSFFSSRTRCSPRLAGRRTWAAWGELPPVVWAEGLG